MSATPPPLPAYALVCREYGDPPQIAVEALAQPLAPAAGEVVIDVACAALNFTDHLMMQGRYQDMPSLPFTPGLELSGVIEAIGPETGSLPVGTRVALFSGQGGLAETGCFPAERCFAGLFHARFYPPPPRTCSGAAGIGV